MANTCKCPCLLTPNICVHCVLLDRTFAAQFQILNTGKCFATYDERICVQSHNVQAAYVCNACTPILLVLYIQSNINIIIYLYHAMLLLLCVDCCGKLFPYSHQTQNTLAHTHFSLFISMCNAYETKCVTSSKFVMWICLLRHRSPS